MSLFTDFDRVMFHNLSDLFHNDVELIPAVNCRSLQVRPCSFQARLDLLEKPNSYVINVDLPGVAKEDIQIQVERGTLTIVAERAEEKHEEGDQYHRTERRFGSIKRVVPLPEQADQDNVKAEFDNGVLQLTVAKKANDVSKKQITIA